MILSRLLAVTEVFVRTEEYRKAHDFANVKPKLNYNAGE